jgi:hypothetical protein
MCRSPTQQDLQREIHTARQHATRPHQVAVPFIPNCRLNFPTLFKKSFILMEPPAGLEPATC